MSVSETLRKKVTLRAENRCEYCGVAQEGQEALFHVDHVLPVSRGGPTEWDNLALACVSCSLRKAARISGLDPASGLQAPLFNPRREPWNFHFRWNDCEVVGISPCGRATVHALAMNRPVALSIRQENKVFGRHPPPGHF